MKKKQKTKSRFNFLNISLLLHPSEIVLTRRWHLLQNSPTMKLNRQCITYVVFEILKTAHSEWNLVHKRVNLQHCSEVFLQFHTDTLVWYWLYWQALTLNLSATHSHEVIWAFTEIRQWQGSQLSTMSGVCAMCFSLLVSVERKLYILHSRFNMLRNAKETFLLI